MHHAMYILIQFVILHLFCAVEASLRPPWMIFQRYVARLVFIKDFLQESRKNRVLLQLQKSLAKFLQETRKDI